MSLRTLTRSHLARWPITRWRMAAALSVAALVAACGGSSSQVDPFVPARLIVFGDELSALATGTGYEHNARKYAVNAIDSTTSDFLCASNPIWVQSLAAHYGLVFDACNASSATVTAYNYASVGATAGGTAGIDLTAQIAGHEANQSGFNADDLVALMIGQNDILALNADVEAGLITQSDALTEVASRGTAVANQINALIDRGAKVLVLTAPELGRTPFALSTSAPSGRSARLSALTSAFNKRVRGDIVQDGRYAGLVVTDDIIYAMSTRASTYGLSNVIDGVCATALPDCTTATLVSGGSATNYLWADTTRFGNLAHAQLGSAAVTRAANNPFSN